jgi:hypothetical protein
VANGSGKERLRPLARVARRLVRGGLGGSSASCDGYCPAEPLDAEPSVAARCTAAVDESASTEFALGAMPARLRQGMQHAVVP